MPALASSGCQVISLNSSLIERSLFLFVSLVTALVVLTNQQFVAESGHWSLLLRFLLWLGLVLLGASRLMREEGLCWFKLDTGCLTDLNHNPCELQEVWSLAPWLILIRYRVAGAVWRRRLVWPDSGSSESLRVLRTILHSAN